MNGCNESSEDACLKERDYLHKDLVKECFYVFFGLVYFVFVVWLSPALHHVFHTLWHDIACCAESAVKHQPTNLHCRL